MSLLFKKALLRTIGFFIWITFSAWLFVQVEYTDEDEVKEKYQLFQSLYEFMAAKYNMTIEEFNNFSNVAHEALSVPKLQWSYSASFDFVFQTVTTVGYGYITPQTSQGQILCIFVAFLGIPITMLALKSDGELIVECVNAIVVKFEKKILKKQEPTRGVQTKSAVILFSLMVILVMIFALLIVNNTDMTLVECIYFWFITFTTIGFGDYVPGKIPQRINQLSVNSSRNHGNKRKSNEETVPLYITIFYLLFCMFGFCVVSSVLNSIMVVFQVEGYRPRCPGCIPRKIGDNVDNNEIAAEQRDTDVTNLNMENTGIGKENVS